MSIETLTGDDFMHLDAATHSVAIGCYNTAVEANIQLAALKETQADKEPYLDTLTSLLQLRKLHKVRLAELEEEEQPTSKMGLGSYGATQLAPAA